MQNNNSKRSMTTKTLAYCALLAALSVVLARWVIPMPNAFTRFSIEAVPIFLAGMLFGWLPGALVGFAADFIGCLFSGYGYNPLFCFPPILYGVCGGVLTMITGKKTNLTALILGFLLPVLLGSIGYQSFTLAAVYSPMESYKASVLYFLASRSIQFGVTAVVDVLVIYLLLKSRVFDRLGLWNNPNQQKGRTT